MEETQPPSSKISTVVPATPRGDEQSEWQLSSMDLLLKLHYIRALYFFVNHAAQGLSIYDLKKPMFPLLDHVTHLSGRIRISESGRPFIKCNDAGVRIAESHSHLTLREWFHQNGSSLHHALLPDHVLGPDLGFSPLVFLKFTWFKCGGLSVGLSWSHVLGDAFSAFNFITKWSRILAGHAPPKTLHVTSHKPAPSPPQNNGNHGNPISVKMVTTVEDLWLAANDTKMVSHTFHVTPNQLNHLVTSIFTCDQNQANDTSYFEILSALVWKHVARIRDSEPKIVTVLTRGGGSDEFPTNDVVISVVEADVAVGKSDVADLAKLIGEEKRVENSVVEKLVEEKEGKENLVVYGARLTFVDLEEDGIYEVVLNGEKPVVVNCGVGGVGGDGVVLVLPGLQDEEDGKSGRMVTVTLPEKEVEQLKEKLREEWGIHSLAF
ncbi:protein ECERIFERUM 2 [Vigna unguiculata]|uniref:Shikimate O-hydroxycinnamoyltransferase n=1 Tax=Vigna unguiculata TaxID=3917 RepID=A0A4D6MIX7_VIGUN|nr:protein ECERIFERUM 2 [Vigna unguiculata]QCE00734.1 shikimate O-hydroxycinnamoyltransferase [Vigna unguiculata]